MVVCKKIGFAYVCVDLTGCRAGPMNETLGNTVASGGDRLQTNLPDQPHENRRY